MKIQNFSDYSKIYEAKLAECEFLTEQNITADDIINPLEILITEEIFDKIASKIKSAASAVGSAVKSAYTNVKDALGRIFSGIVNFFKNFSIKKLLGSIWSKIKEIGTKAWNTVKRALSGFNKFIVSNSLCDENNKPSFKRVWEVMCEKAKGIINWDKEGVTHDKLNSIGSQVKINEANDSKSIGDDEVKYYGFFEKVAHAMGIQNARFNGVVSQIMKKGTIGLAIMGMLKMAGIPFAGLSLGLSPVAMGVIGGMLLMAGLIILAIWVCKPYPTVDDCLAYLHTAFGGSLATTGMVNIFIQDIDIIYIQNTTIFKFINKEDKEDKEDSVGDSKVEDLDKVEDVKPLKLMYPTMIKNLQSLKSMIISFDGVRSEGDVVDKFDKFKDKSLNKKSGDKIPKVGSLCLFTNKKGVKKKVKVISLKNDTSVGADKTWLTKDDIEGESLASGYVSVISRDKDGKFTSKSPNFVVKLDQLTPLKESLILEKEFGKSPRNVEVKKGEDYLTQALNNIRKSIKSIKDEKDKGIAITTKFLGDILDKKMDTSSKEPIKNLYKEIYSYLYGSKSKTLSDFGPLYKESIEILSDKNKYQVVAEKIARLAKRSLQFEGENMYSGLGEFGADMKDFNTTLKEIMASIKSEAIQTKENYVFKNYNNK